MINCKFIIVQAADSISKGDVIDAVVRSQQSFDLLPAHAVINNINNINYIVCIISNTVVVRAWTTTRISKC